MPDTGPLVAAKAQLCNVAGSSGAAHWYRLSAALPGSTTSYVQLELWDGRGAFAAGKVQAGTFTISGADASPTTCGVCMRGVGDKGAAGVREYFATSGTVTVTAVGIANEPISATFSNLSFVEIDATSKSAVSDGCAAAVAGTKIDGTVMQVGGGGGGTGGGGGGGMGMCATGVGD
jgi:hypothetical protein